MKILVENDDQYKGMAEALERVMPFDAEDAPRKVFALTRFSQSKCCSFPVADSQVKNSPPGFLLTFLACWD